MEPIVYIYQDHLQDFWNSGQSQCFGAAFEWKGEQVYHVYIKYPQVAPTGYSMPCLFRVVDTDDYGKAEDVALSVYASMPEEAKRVPISSTKSMIGHLLGAAGAVELIACIKSVTDGYLHPNVGLTETEDEMDLQYIKGKGIETEVKTVLSNSLGFGGHNATLLVKKFS